MRPLRKIVLLLSALFFICSAGSSPAECPEDPNDTGVCDTLYVEVDPSDALFTGSGQLVEVNIRLTHDLSGWDSLCYLYIPLSFQHTNSSKYCSLSSYWNSSWLYGGPNMARSIFRDFEGETNMIWDLCLRCPYLAWCWWEPDLDGVSHVGLPLNGEFFCANCGLLGGTSRSLLATLTFRVEDTMTVCIDSCYLASTGHLRLNTVGSIFVPRDNLPYCFTVSAPATGDANADGAIDLEDAIYVFDYLFRYGPPAPLNVADVTCNGEINIGDVIYLLNYLFRGGSPPSC
jgi:hypothetical protein